MAETRYAEIQKSREPAWVNKIDLAHEALKWAGIGIGLTGCYLDNKVLGNIGINLFLSSYIFPFFAVPYCTIKDAIAEKRARTEGVRVSSRQSVEDIE